MSRRVVSFAITIDGCLYAAASLGCPTSVTSSYDWPTGVVVLPGTLPAESVGKLSWDESIKPTTGDLNVSGMTLAFDEAVATSGVANGRKVWSWMFSRRNREMRSAQINVNVTSTDTSITVASDPGFGTGAQVIWIDREAINCSSYNAGTKRFAVAASGRGYLGTRAADHNADPANAFAPLVWDEFPNPQRRRAIVWMIEGGVATPLWRGYVGRAPRLTSDGKRWELQLDHAWTTQQQRPLGPSKATTRLIGYQPETFRVTVGINDPGGGVATARYSAIIEAAATWPETLDEVCQSIVDKLNAQLALAAPITGSVRYTISNNRPRFDSTLSTDHTLSVTGATARRGSRVPLEPGWSANSTRDGGSNHNAIARWGYPIRGAHFGLIPGATNTVTIDDIAGIPTSGLVTANTDGVGITRVQWVLAGYDQDDYAFHLALTGVDTATRRVGGVFRRSSVRGSVELAADALFTAVTPVSVAVRVESTHWLYAIRRGALSTAYGIGDQADPRDWSWDTADRVVGSTGGESSVSRVWVFDGSTTLGEFVKDASTLDVCPVAIRNSYLTFDVIDPPLESDAAEYTVDLTAGEGIHLSVPGYSTQPEGIYNAVSIKREDAPSVTVNNQTSIALYGISRPLEVEVKGAVASIVEGKSPFELARGMLSRVLGMWSEPVELVTVTVPYTAVTQAFLCSIVSVTSRVLPNGEGLRDQTLTVTRKGRVIGRALDAQSGTMRLEVLCFPHRVSGYAAAARVDSFSSNKVFLANMYMPEASTATNYAGTSSDGGASRWQIGDVVRFRVFDDALTGEEGGWEIIDVDPGAGSITLSADPSGGATDWVALLAGGALVEVVSDDYDASPAISTTQQGFAYIGSRTAGTLNGDPLKEWSP